MIFNPDEFKIITNSDFLKQKKKLINTISETFVRDISNIHSQELSRLESKAVTKFSSKLSRGENYLELPYVVFDHPNSFQLESTYAFRTMFWWANEFSATIHLGGTFLNENGFKLIKKEKQLKKLDAHICINQTPWDYHFNETNYLPINEIERFDLSPYLKKGFLKIAIKEDLDNYKGFLSRTKRLYAIFLKCF